VCVGGIVVRASEFEPSSFVVLVCVVLLVRAKQFELLIGTCFLCENVKDVGAEAPRTSNSVCMLGRRSM
jgi:hypothetical protein